MKYPIMRPFVLLSTVLLAGAAQVPFNVDTTTAEWDFAQRPAPNSTHHLIFDTVNSLLQHWPNTRYRNGHTIVPGTVAPGTLLYHGTSRDSLPEKPDWVATDPEHSYLFCRGQRDGDGGCWHLTLVATRPLRVLYFDGSSAAKIEGGPMHSQDILIWKDVVPEKTWDEFTRIRELCRIWGDRVDGFVRMEMDFEIMLCDFTKGVEVASFLKIKGWINLPPRPNDDFEEDGRDSDSFPHEHSPPHFPPPRRPTKRPPPPPPPHHPPGSAPPPGPPNPPSRKPPSKRPPPLPHFPPPPSEDVPPPRGPHWGPHHAHDEKSNHLSPLAPSQGPHISAFNGFAVFESGSWHNRYPGETRIQLDLTRLTSFYDIVSFPSLVPAREGKERWDHNLIGIEKKDVNALWGVVEGYLEEESWTRRGSGVDWKTLYRNVLERYADRLEVLEYLLVNATNASEGLSLAHDHLSTMLTPYLLHSASPANSTGETEWAVGVWKHCATTHTAYISSSALSELLTPSEKVLLRALEGVNKEICRVLVGLWAQGIEGGVDSIVSEEVIEDKLLMKNKWMEETRDLMKWLDWSVWVRCRPACGFEELCYLPTWPFLGPRRPRRRTPGGPGGASPPDTEEPYPPTPPSLFLEDDTDDWERPQPKCVRRMYPFPR